MVSMGPDVVSSEEILSKVPDRIDSHDVITNREQRTERDAFCSGSTQSAFHVRRMKTGRSQSRVDAVPDDPKGQRCCFHFDHPTACLFR